MMRLRKIFSDHQVIEKEKEMRYAVISDIHGNKPAFDTVLADAKQQGIDDFIFAGDYCLSGPFPDECISTLREIENKVMIRGNEERYLENLIGKDQSKWTDGQMQISYWNFRNIKKDNLDYLLSIPHKADFLCNGRDIHILHHVDDFIKVSNLENYFNRSGALALKYGDRKVTSEYHRKQMLDAIEQTPGFIEAISTLADGIYIFGHSHIQWSYKIPDREIYLINPGSCGLPLDCIKNTLPYTILSINDAGDVLIEEQRVPFDMNGYVEKVKQTSQFKEANVWTKVIIKELLNAREHLVFFLKFADEYANEIGDDIRPFTVDTWERAYAEWEDKGFIC